MAPPTPPSPSASTGMRSRIVDTVGAGTVAGSLVVLGASYYQPDMTREVAAAWQVILTALFAGGAKLARRLARRWKLDE